MTRRLTVTTNKVTRKVKVKFDKEASKMVKEVKKVQEEDKEMDWRLMTNMEVLVVATYALEFRIGEIGEAYNKSKFSSQSTGLPPVWRSRA